MIVSPFVEALAAQHPGVVLRVHEGVSNLLREHMADGLLDIGVVPFDAVPAPGYRQTPLVREPIALVGRAQDGLSPDRPVGLSHLDGLKLVLPRRPNVLRAQVERAMEREGLAFRLAVETDTLSLCLDLARRGVGATLVPVCSLLCNGSDDAIGWAPVEGQSITWALWDNLARTHSQAVREGRRLLVATVAEALARGVWIGAERVEAA